VHRRSVRTHDYVFQISDCRIAPGAPRGEVISSSATGRYRPYAEVVVRAELENRSAPTNCADVSPRRRGDSVLALKIETMSRSVGSFQTSGRKLKENRRRHE